MLVIQPTVNCVRMDTMLLVLCKQDVQPAKVWTKLSSLDHSYPAIKGLLWYVTLTLIVVYSINGFIVWY